MLIFLFLLINYDLGHVPCLSIYQFSEPSLVIVISQGYFALRPYGNFGLDPIFLIGEYVFNSVGMKARHGYQLLIYFKLPSL